MVNRKAAIEFSEPPVSELRTVARKDPLAERILQQIVHLMKAHSITDKKELARRAKQPYWRVRKFLNRELPYPPLTFLNDLLVVFGYTLPEALVQAGMLPVKPITPHAFSKFVLEVAELLAKHDDEYVKALKKVLEERSRTRSR